MEQLELLKEYLNNIECTYSESEDMKLHTTFKIGGPAEVFIKPASVDSCVKVVKFCNENHIPLTFLGSGSNVLVSDFGIKGAVLHTGGLSDIKVNGYEITCGAGVKLSRLCSAALENSLSGLEFAWGIPGSAGGAAFMNAGAYGGEMKDVLFSCQHITPEGELVTLSADQMKLGYRTSIYAKNNWLITDVTVKLNPGIHENIQGIMDDLYQRRRTKQPLDMPSAGSVFKRPIGSFAGTLIEECGLKGCSVGGATVSEKHAGFIVNSGNATSSDVLRLVEKIQDTVFDRTGIQLECEIKTLK